jgi:hypothetical protein
MNFKQMLKRKASGASVDKLKARLEKDKKGNKYDDDRIWKYELDKAGMASATLRFLPTTDADVKFALANNPELAEEEVPFWVERYDHGFKEGGKWYINVCPSTFGDEDCPVCNHNSNEIDATGLSFKDLPKTHPVKVGVRERKRKQSYYANILVVKDPANPHNEGKVMIWKFGWAVLQQITDMIVPQFADEESVDVSDMIAGRNYNLKLYKENEQITYKKCGFTDESAIDKDVKKLEVIWDAQYPLHTFIDDSQRVKVEDLTKQFNRVMNLKNAPVIDTPAKDAEDYPQDTPVNEAPEQSIDASASIDEDEEVFKQMLADSA